VEAHRRNQALIVLWIFISSFGILSIYSASMPQLISTGQLPFKTALTQLMVFLFSIILLTVLINMKKYSYRMIYRLADLSFYFTLISLAAVLVIGADRGGAKMVIDLGFVDYQPVELYKITVILYMAKHMSDENKPKSLLELLKLVVIAGSGTVLLFLQPDLGGAVIVGAVIVFMIFLYGEFIYTLLKISAAALFVVVVGGFSMIRLSSELLYGYQSARFTAWLDPFSDALDTGWGTVNSLIAISNGNITGSGYLNSIQKTILDTGASTDYIFVIICEEWGLFGAILVIGSLTFIAFMSMVIGNNAKDRFGMLYSYGFGLLILIQMFVNIGGVVNIIPMTGVTLPFISSGLNSFLFLSIGLFIVVVIDRESVRERRKKQAQSEKLFL
jgi:cell division protein FtsW